MKYIELTKTLNLLVPIMRDAKVFAGEADKFFGVEPKTPGYENTRTDLLEVGNLLLGNVKVVMKTLETINKAESLEPLPAAEPKKATKK